MADITLKRFSSESSFVLFLLFLYTDFTKEYMS